MFKNIKLLNKLKNDSNEIEYENDYISEANESIIYVKANSKDDIISKYSAGEDLTLNNELIDYLQQDNLYMDISKPLNIRFNSEKEYSDGEKSEIKKAYRNCFFKQVSDVNEELYYNKKLCFYMGIMAIIFLALFVVAKFIEPLGILSEIMLIVSWVFVWELTENIFFNRPKLTRKAIQLYKLLNARIEFYN